jgi:hypothetical protein
MTGTLTLFNSDVGVILDAAAAESGVAVGSALAPPPVHAEYFRKKLAAALDEKPDEAATAVVVLAVEVARAVTGVDVENEYIWALVVVDAADAPVEVAGAAANAGVSDMVASLRRLRTGHVACSTSPSICFLAAAHMMPRLPDVNVPGAASLVPQLRGSSGAELHRTEKRHDDRIVFAQHGYQFLKEGKESCPVDCLSRVI